MALQKCMLNLNQRLKELDPHGTLEFPCAGYSSYYTDREEESIPWHWHEDLEIIHIVEGCLELKMPSETVYIEAGSAFFINSNILHYGAGADRCHLHSLVFSPALISGNEDSVFARKYIQPLISSNSFSGFSILPAEYPELLQWFCQAFHAMKQEPDGFEFIVRENLSRICLFLTQKFADKPDLQGTAQNQNNLRIRKMLEYIHKNYADAVTLSNIACAADISERECLRCFQKTIQLSPIQYLLKYRIMRGAEKLLDCPEESISAIAISCGFDSPSSFSQLFKRFYNRTPREYRRSKA